MKDFPLYRSLRDAAIAAAIIVLPLLLCAATPLLGGYLVMDVLFLLPMALCLSGLVAGALPMILGLAAALISMYALLGAQGLILTAVYVMPILAAFVLIVSLRCPFWRGCTVLVGVHVLSLSAVYLLLQRLTGGQLYTAAGNAVASLLENSEIGDTLLYEFYAMGLIGLKDSLQGDALERVLGGYVLSDAARQDMLLSVRTLISTQLPLMVPQLLVEQSILGGVLCLLLPLRFGFIAEEKRSFLSSGGPELDESAPGKVNFPDLGMPPFSTWHIPRGIGWQVGVALAAGYVLRLGRAPALSIAGMILYAGASSVFIIQGAATVNYLQKLRGSKRFWRVAVPIILMMLSALTLIGVFDQINNFRGLRKPRQPKEEP